jgi:hypothetical protein
MGSNRKELGAKELNLSRLKILAISFFTFIKKSPSIFFREVPCLKRWARSRTNKFKAEEDE